MKKQVVLITGIAGLIGSRLADWILKNTDVKIVGVDDMSGGYYENIPDQITHYTGDCSNEVFLNMIFEKERPDYVYHLAAYAAEGLSPFIRNFNYTNNLIATTNVVNNCINYDVKRLIFTSTMAVYGAGIPPFDEDDQPSPIDPYGIAKYACEQDIRVAGEQHDLDWCIIRPHNVYGRNQNIWDKYRNVLGIWMYQSLHGQPMTIYGDGQQVRAFSYIDDCLEPMWKAAIYSSTSKEIINLGGTEDITILEAANVMQGITGNSIVHLEPRHEVKHAFPTWKKSVEMLNYKDTTSLGEGLLKMWKWAKDQPYRKRKEWNRYEVNKKIYSYWQITK